jgi:hypothetical protein
MADSPEHQKHVHLLNRITYGVTPEELARLNEMGSAAFLEEQLRPEQIPDPLVEQKISGLKTIHLSSRELFELYPPPKQAGGDAPGRMGAMEGPRAVILELHARACCARSTAKGNSTKSSSTSGATISTFLPAKAPTAGS